MHNRFRELKEKYNTVLWKNEEQAKTITFYGKELRKLKKKQESVEVLQHEIQRKEEKLENKKAEIRALRAQIIAERKESGRLFPLKKEEGSVCFPTIIEKRERYEKNNNKFYYIQ